MKKWIGVAAVVLAVAVIVTVVAVPAIGRSRADLRASTAISLDQGDWDEMVSYCHGEGGMMGGGMMGFGDNVTLKRVAGLLGVTYEQLIARLDQGQTIAQIAQTQGVATSLVVTTILAPQSEMLQVRVKYGYLTDTQAQAILEQARLWVEQAVSTTRTPASGSTPGYGRGNAGGMMGGGMMGGGMMGGGMMGGGMMGRGTSGW